MAKKYLAKYGQALLDNGYKIVPIRPGFKYPQGLSNWQNLNVNRKKLRQFLANGFANGGVGIQTGDEVNAVDLDIREALMAQEMQDYVFSLLGESPVRTGQAPKRLLIYAPDRPWGKLTSSTYVNTETGEEHKVEILAKGQQFVAYHVHPDTGEPYAWEGGEPAEIEPWELKTIAQEQAQQIVNHFEDLAGRRPDWVKKEEGGRSSAGEDWGEDADLANYKAPRDDVTLDDAREVLIGMDPGCKRDPWRDVGFAMHHQFRGSEEAFDLFNEWSAGLLNEGVPNDYSEHNARKLWDSIKDDPRQGAPIAWGSMRELGRRIALAGSDDWGGDGDSTSQEESLADYVDANAIAPEDLQVSWLVEGLLLERRIYEMFGRWKGGKTIAAVDLCIRLSRGETWGNRRTQPALVVYVAGESVEDIQARIAGWRQHHGKDVGPFYLRTKPVHLTNKEYAKRLSKEIKQLKSLHQGLPLMLVIDTLNRNFGGGYSENSDEGMGLFVTHLIDGVSRHNDATTMVVHHSGHGDTDRSRGHSSFAAALDGSLKVELDGNVVKVSSSFMRSTEGDDELAFQIQSVTLPVKDNFDNDVTAPVLEFDPDYDPGDGEEPDALRQVRGRRHRQLVDVLTRMAESRRDFGEQPRITRDALLDEARTEDPEWNPDNARRTFRQLIDRGVFAHDENGHLIIPGRAW